MAVTFRILHTGCGSDPGAFDLFINDVLVASAPSSTACDCTGELLEVTLTDAPTLALVDPDLCNRFRVAASDGTTGTRLGFVQVTLQTSNGSEEACLFDGDTGNTRRSCTLRALCDPPGFDESITEVEGAFCPVCGGALGDPTVYEPDLDRDRIGNTCDEADGALRVSKVRIRGSTSNGRPNGSISLQGDILLASPEDRLGPASGIEVQVSDGLALDQRFLWGTGDCQEFSNGSVSCQSPDGNWTGTFTRQTGLPERYSFDLNFSRVAATRPFQAPVIVRLTDRPPLAVVGIDRVGAIATCSVSTNSIQCNAP